MKLEITGFSLRDTLNCGQCFRWEEQPDGSFKGIVNGKSITVFQKDDLLILPGVDDSERPFWERYFDFGTDYAALRTRFSEDPTLKLACEKAGGIRLLQQDPWETLCSFIISQNNNIPRIKMIIARLCEQFGERTEDGYAFPAPEALAGCTVEDLAPLKAGFRAKYILDAARKVVSGELDLPALSEMPLTEARAKLMNIYGVGPKVAECALLYGFHRLDAFPIDTWIKKALQRYYPAGFPDFAEPKGVAQQFLFHYIRLEDHVI